MIKQLVNIKPLSINEAYTGRRFATPELKSFKKEVSCVLRPSKVTFGKIQLKIVWYFSNSGADCSNPLKAFEDCLQKKYGFNDNKVYRIELIKLVVPKGFEKIYFEITEYKETNL